MRILGVLLAMAATMVGAAAVLITAKLFVPAPGAALTLGIGAAILGCLAFPLWLDARLTRAARRQDSGARRMAIRVLGIVNLLWVVGLCVIDRHRAPDALTIAKTAAAWVAARAHAQRPAEGLPPGFVQAARGLPVSGASPPDRSLAYRPPSCALRYAFVGESRAVSVDLDHPPPGAAGSRIQGTFVAATAANGNLVLRDFRLRMGFIGYPNHSELVDVPAETTGSVELVVDGEGVRVLAGSSPVWDRTGSVSLSFLYPPLPARGSTPWRMAPADGSDAGGPPPTVRLDRWIRVAGEIAAVLSVRETYDQNAAAPVKSDGGVDFEPSLSAKGRMSADYVILANGWPLYADVEADTLLVMGTPGMDVRQRLRESIRLHLVDGCGGPTLGDPPALETPTHAAPKD